MGNDESHFHVWLTVRDSHKTVSTDHNFWRKRIAKVDSNWGPSAYQPNTLLLGQTSSQDAALAEIIYIYQLYYLHARELKKIILGSVAVISHHYAHDVHVNQALPPFASCFYPLKVPKKSSVTMKMPIMVTRMMTGMELVVLVKLQAHKAWTAYVSLPCVSWIVYLCNNNNNKIVQYIIRIKYSSSQKLIIIIIISMLHQNDNSTCSHIEGHSHMLPQSNPLPTRWGCSRLACHTSPLQILLEIRINTQGSSSNKNKDLSCLRQLSPGMCVNIRYISPCMCVNIRYISPGMCVNIRYISPGMCVNIRYISPGMCVNIRYINYTRGTSSWNSKSPKCSPMISNANDCQQPVIY